MFVWMMLILITLTISLFVSDEKTVYADGIEDEAEDCEFGEYYKDSVRNDSGDRNYYKIEVKEKMDLEIRISSKALNSGSSGLHISVYNSKGKKVMEPTAFDFKYNMVKGRCNAKAERTFNKGNYYIEFEPYAVGDIMINYKFIVIQK